ncbi:MAG: PGF-pre-PGF domain-containing protein [Candidatus Aenigmarchaeota archaeon]|nr:PGF-pre-PGF domain-containing protein [Candidatus Aenigmarchaeota archaeon]
MVKPLPIALLATLAILLLAPVALAQSYTFFMEPPDGRDGLVELEVRQPDIAVHGISFRLRGQHDGYTVRIDRIGNDLEWVYDNFHISTPGLEAEPEDVIIELKVNRTWINDNNVELSTIALNVYDGVWKRFQAVPYAEDPDFLYFISESPRLNTSFALSGEPVPVVIEISSPCNGNDVCEPERGEDRDNCPDCVILAQTRCIPSEKYCSGDSLFECSEDGSAFTLETCVFGCADGACLLSAPGVAGMAVAQDPLFVTVVAALLAVILLLAVLVKRMRSELLKVERRKDSNEEFKKLVKS